MDLEEIKQGDTGKVAANKIFTNDTKAFAVLSDIATISGDKYHPTVEGPGYWTGTVGQPVSVNTSATYERNSIIPVVPGDVVEFFGVYVAQNDEGICALLDSSSNYVSRLQGNNAASFNQATGYFKLVVPSGVAFIAPYHRVNGGTNWPTSRVLMAINYSVTVNAGKLPDGSLSAKGVLQLATEDSNNETKAATPKTVRNLKNLILVNNYLSLPFDNVGAGFWTGTVGNPPTISTQYAGYRYMPIFDITSPTTLAVSGLSTDMPSSVSVFHELTAAGNIIRRVNKSDGVLTNGKLVFALSANTGKIALSIYTASTPTPTNPASVVVEAGDNVFSLNPAIKTASTLNKLNSVTSMYDRGAAVKVYSDTRIPIWLVAGQSNADGRNTAATFPTSFVDENGQTVNYLDSGVITNSLYAKRTVNPTLAPYTLGTNLWAFDAIVLKRLAHRLGTSVRMFKRSLGGTAIDPAGSAGGGYWTPRTENITTGLKLILELEQATRALLASGNYKIMGCLWHQGEGDSATGPANRYYNNFIDVIDYIRGFSGNPKLPFIFGTISHASQQYSAVVEQAQKDIDAQDANVHLVDMSAAGLIDPYHFDAAGSEYLGTEMYKIIRDKILV